METKSKKVANRRKPAAPSVDKAPVSAVTPEPDANEFRIRGDVNDTVGLRVAKIALGPVAPSALTAKTYATKLFGPSSMNDAMTALNSSVNAVQAGNLSGVEAMLMSQAAALNAIFNELAMRAHGQAMMKHMEAFLRLAFKAQNQCRMTLETLANVKNPPVFIGKQANITNGPQQVNNGGPAVAGSHAAKTKSTQTGLLEASDVERLDTRAQGPAGSADPHMETVATVHRPAHR